MFTKWFKISMKNYIPHVFNQGNGLRSISIPIKNVQNTTYYPAGSLSGVAPSSLTTNANNAGISVGTGNRSATDEDYNLQSTITSGLTAVITRTAEEDGTLVCITFNVVLTNTTDSDITVKEIGIKSNINCGATAGATTNFNPRTVLIDRTVLSEPVVVPARGNAAILYTLKEDYSFT